MIPFWYLPYALACGNTYILKPSERVPLTMQRMFELIEQCGFPPGVVNMVKGGVEAVERNSRPPDHTGSDFRGFHEHCETRLQPRVPEWEAGASSGWGKKSHHHSA